MVYNVIATPCLLQHAKETQWQDAELRDIRNRLQNGEQIDGWSTNHERFLYYKGRLAIADSLYLREALMTEAHQSKFAIHPGSTKMYQNMKHHYWWKGMKRDVACFVAKCMICQQVKAEHRRIPGLMQPLEIPEWKWEKITMDFVTGLPTTFHKHNAI